MTNTLSKVDRVCSCLSHCFHVDNSNRLGSFTYLTYLEYNRFCERSYISSSSLKANYSELLLLEYVVKHMYLP